VEASEQISGRDLGRIAAFTDGVMAVAITLLVLNLEVPRLTPGEDLGDALVDLLPSLGAYALAFALVGRFWVIHHNLFEKLRGFDRALMALNLLFLALIVHEHHREETEPAVTVGFGLTTVFLLSVPAAFLSVHIAEALWISTVVLRYPLRRLGGLTSSR
jgi:hypothetical protein